MQYLYYTLFAYTYLAFMGAGIAYFIVPNTLRSYVAVFCPFIGYAWVMLLSWYAYFYDLPGTDSYSAYIAVTGMLINGVAYWHWRQFGQVRLNLFSTDSQLALLSAVLGAIAISIPFVSYPHGPTTMSLVNNDIADYACMARLIKEYPRTTDQGFLGQFVGFRVNSDEIWFGPAAVTSLLSSALGQPTFRLQSLCVNLFFAIGIPFIYIVSRELFRLERWYCCVLACLYALHPVIVRVAYDGFHGQVIATSIVPGLMIVGMLLARESSWSGKFSYVPLTVALAWALIISYSFMLIFAFGVVSMCAILDNVYFRRSSNGLKTGAVFAVTIFLAFALSPFRATMLYKQLRLVNADNGYYMGFLSPVRILGALGGDVFGSDPHSQWAIVLSVLVVVVLFAGVWVSWQSRNRDVFFLLVPLMAIYAFSVYLFVSAAPTKQVYASYKAYKILAIFLPIFLCVFYAALWHVGTKFGKLRIWFLVACLSAVGLAELYTTYLLIRRLQETKSVVTEDMADLLRIDADPRITSINIYSGELWPYLWHTYFLMNKTLHLQMSAYSRTKSLPTGVYDLIETKHIGRAAERRLVHDTEFLYLNPTYRIAKAENPLRPLVEFGYGWWGNEPTHSWSGALGNQYSLILESPCDQESVQLLGTLFLPLRPGDSVSLSVNGKPVDSSWEGMLFETHSFTLKRGRSTVVFTHLMPPNPAGHNDPRTLLAAWQDFLVNSTGNCEDQR